MIYNTWQQLKFWESLIAPHENIREVAKSHTPVWLITWQKGHIEYRVYHTFKPLENIAEGKWRWAGVKLFHGHKLWIFSKWMDLSDICC